jgi:hypothetical protein
MNLLQVILLLSALLFGVAWTSKCRMGPRQILVVLTALLLCVAWTLLVWPGSSTHGHFYPYPVSLPLFAVWALGWSAVLVPTFVILRGWK